MTDRPILFSGPMVRALLAGTKTQTRRVLTRLPRFGKIREFGPSDTLGYDWHFRDKDARWHDLRRAELLKVLPFAVGDRLWVREAWRSFERADHLSPIEMKSQLIWLEADGDGPLQRGETPFGRLRASMHMPRWGSRLTLAVTEVRVQRLQAISEADAIAEGIAPALPGRPAIAQYFGLWDSLNAERGYGSDTNPWVVAVSFTVEQRNIDEVRR